MRIGSCGWSSSDDVPSSCCVCPSSVSHTSLRRLLRRLRFSRFLELTSAKCSTSNLAGSQCRMNGLMLITGTGGREKDTRTRNVTDYNTLICYFKVPFLASHGDACILWFGVAGPSANIGTWSHVFHKVRLSLTTKSNTIPSGHICISRHV